MLSQILSCGKSNLIHLYFKNEKKVKLKDLTSLFDCTCLSVLILLRWLLQRILRFTSNSRAPIAWADVKFAIIWKAFFMLLLFLVKKHLELSLSLKLLCPQVFVHTLFPQKYIHCSIVKRARKEKIDVIYSNAVNQVFIIWSYLWPSCTKNDWIFCISYSRTGVYESLESDLYFLNFWIIFRCSGNVGLHCNKFKPFTVISNLESN